MSHEHHHHGAAGATESTLVELLDLDAEVLPGYLSEVTALIRDHAGDAPVHRILDMGSGTGTGTLALDEGWPGLGVVDLS
jgi:methylase of polypeptide subunit release factors